MTLPLFAVLTPVWVAAGKAINSAGKTTETYAIRLERIAVLHARTAAHALTLAKQAGYFCPIIESTQEELQ